MLMFNSSSSSAKNRQFQGNKRTVKDNSGQFTEKEADETLFLELALRGIDLSKLQEEPTTANIVKIG